VRRLLPLLAAGASAAVLLAGCGGGARQAAPPPATTIGAPSPAHLLGPGGRAVYQSAGWGVVVRGAKAAAVRLVAGTWRVERSSGVKIAILGPQGPATRTPQVAVEFRAKSPLVETGLWVDGHELLEKGGGLTPRRATIYGAPAKPLKRGKHVAVAYGRTETAGRAVAWTFTVA
jgi:hypothetical protein